MNEATDPEPTDKRTKEWKEWFARQLPSSIPTSLSKTAEDPPASTGMSAHDAAVFFGYFLGGMAAANVPMGKNGESWESRARQGYYNFRNLMTWVRSGDAERDYAALIERDRREEERQAEIARRDAEGEAARLAKARAAHGEKAPVGV